MMQQSSESERPSLVITGSDPSPTVIKGLVALLPDSSFDLSHVSRPDSSAGAATWHIDLSRQQPAADSNSITILLNRTSVEEGFRTILPSLANSPPLLTVDLYVGESHRIGASIALVADSFKQSIELTQKFVAETLTNMLLEGFATASGISGLGPKDRSPVTTGLIANIRGLVVSSSERVKRFLFWKLFQERWDIAVADLNDQLDPLSLDKQHWRVLNLPGEQWQDYYADPFFYRQQAPSSTPSTEWLLYEHYDHKNQKGEIRAEKLGENGAKANHSLLSLPGHLSYPYVFQLENQTYLLPEQEATGRPPQSYPLSNNRHEALISGKPVTMPGLPPLFDSTIFKYGDYYWLLGTLKGFSNSTHLGLWFAISPFDTWHPHRYMPVAINSQYGRPAGTPFIHQGRLTIPLQNSSRGYGERMELFEVIQLSPKEIDWRHVGTISKENIKIPGAQVRGVHTLSVSDCSIAIDFRTLTLKK